MENRFKKALECGEFAVTCEMIPGRGAQERPLERAFDEAREIYATGRVHAISITDNPGGNPAILADGIALELLEDGIVPLVHFTCKDRNRNQVLAQLYGLERAGVENLLFMAGDYQASGWNGMARPVFDLDSVHIQMLAREMCEGLRVDEHGMPAVEASAHFFRGGVVNPFKYREGETIPQYMKLEKKIIGGAQFIVSQLGYDCRKMEELMWYVLERGYTTPLIANVFVTTRFTAQLMRRGAIAGCYVSDELMEVLEAEAALSDKGRARRIERAACQVAAARGMGYAGVHIGGFGVDAETVCAILDRADELAGDWRVAAANVAYGSPEGYYLYAPETGADGHASGLNAYAYAARHEDADMREDEFGRTLFSGYGLSLFFHHWALTRGERGGKLLASACDALERAYGGPGFPHALEHAGKAALYGCIDCGDCGLEACAYSCPMAACPKCQRNGPCGGSSDGWCEVYPNERFCIWYKAYHRLSSVGETQRMASFITPPNDWGLRGTSAWSNYTHDRDNAARRIPVTIEAPSASGPEL